MLKLTSNQCYNILILLAETIKPIVLWAACFHDLGKLDEKNQEVLRGEKKAKNLPINHVDAGVAYLKEREKKTEAALLVLSHHHGLPSLSRERLRLISIPRDKVKEVVDDSLNRYLLLHQMKLQ